MTFISAPCQLGRSDKQKEVLPYVSSLPSFVILFIEASVSFLTGKMAVVIVALIRAPLPDPKILCFLDDLWTRSQVARGCSTGEAVLYGRGG